MTTPTPTVSAATVLTQTSLTQTALTPAVLTPTVGKSLRKSLFWIGAAVFLIVLAIILMVSRGAAMPDGTPLSATSAGPAGSKALVEVLRKQGVDVIATNTLQATLDALLRNGPSNGASTTLMLHDSAGYLDRDQLQKIGSIAEHTVLIDPGLRQLQALAPAIGAAGSVNGPLEADCAVAAVDRAESVLGDGSGYRLIDDTANAKLCLGSGDDTFSLISLEDDGHRMTVLGTTAALSNEHISERGNAALGLALFGEHETVIWYQPDISDLSGEGAPTIAELTPEWLSLVLGLLMLVFIAAAVWRGRTLGPLVVENLPVIVPASETMEGRARLYQKASARLRALDALRIGTISRLAQACGVSQTAGADEVAAVAASVTGRNHAEVNALLLDSVPQTNRDLIRLSDELLSFEKDVVKATRPGAETAATQPPKPGE